jgi:protein O-GlcNAc transferase
MCTTGMTAMDYRITDGNLDPPGASERFYSETLVRLPCVVAFSPAADSPPVNPPPVMKSGTITLGSFNNYAKIGDEVVALWSRILASLPAAKLLLVAQGGDEPAMREAVVARFAKYGARPQQLSVIGRQPLTAFLHLFHGVDMALDPFPYNGGTTSMHTLWMGVPIIALEGSSEIARSTSGLLRSIGLDQLVAGTEAEYHDIAVALAADLPRLAELRAGLRQRMADSTICNAPAVTRSLEAAYRDMWRRWCMR